MGKEVSIDKISKVNTDFVFGKGEENSIIVGGGALESVKNWTEVKSLVAKLVSDVYNDGKANPGEAYFTNFVAGTIPQNISKGLHEAWDKLKKGENPWKDNSQNSPIHVLGSFSISIRVNANGTTATVCVYDSKTFRSLSDGHADKSSNKKREDSENQFLTNTYQRYLWIVNL